MTQITMAGGAINLGFNEVLWSMFSNTSNSSNRAVLRSDINTHDWSCLIVYHPQVINPFVAFKSSNIMNQRYSSLIRGSDPIGTTINLCLLNDNTYFYLYGECTLLLLA